MKKWKIIITLLLSSCIGVDELDDPADHSILTDVTSLMLLTGETHQATATYYYNMWTELPNTSLFWVSENVTIASVDNVGLITAIAKGQTRIKVFNPGIDTATIDITVVATDQEVAKVEVSATKTSFQIGDTLHLVAAAYSIGNVKIADKKVNWLSSDENTIKVDSLGVALAVADGEADITATIDGVKSTPIRLVVGRPARSGTFQGSGSYDTSGSAMIYVDQNEDLILELGSDFETSFALGTFVYLSNSTSGTVVRSQGLEISEIKSNGAQSFNISQIKDNVGLNDFQYVVMLCKPASITFGYAEMK